MKTHNQKTVIGAAMLLMLVLWIGNAWAASCGDVNSDNTIDIIDALMTAQHYVGLNPQPFKQAMADVNGDGLVTIIDALLVAQYYVDLIPVLPGCSTTPNCREIGLYRTFERSLTNTNIYSNKFTDVDLNVTYTSPSNKTYNFYGFFDGDGKGGGDRNFGNVWKMRFMPDELGTWRYTWSWSDGTSGGQDYFTAVAAGAGKGILRPYRDNPHWLSYNGTEPVFLKSYFESGHTSIAQPLDWLINNVYQVLIDNDYNHFQVFWLLPVLGVSARYLDGPVPDPMGLRLYEAGKASTTQRFDVWHTMEEDVQWLNDKNVGLHMFVGFCGPKSSGPDWKALTNSEQDFFVKYVISRLAPYANIAGWNYSFETPGNDSSGDLELAGLIRKYDIFDHLRSYEDEEPGSNEYHRLEYNWATVENHGYSDNSEWGSAWTHHMAALDGYVSGKPVFMTEGNALWRKYWHTKINDKLGHVDQNDLRQAAWACVTAGASFTWCGHGDDLYARHETGLPFFDNINNEYKSSAKYIDILTDIMNNEVEFYRMTPQDNLLSNHDPKAVWCLAEAGRQYLVFSTSGQGFTLNVASGEYTNNMWLDTMTGGSQSAGSLGGGSRSFTPPNTSTDWVLILHS